MLRNSKDGEFLKRGIMKVEEVTSSIRTTTEWKNESVGKDLSLRAAAVIDDLVERCEPILKGLALLESKLPKDLQYHRASHTYDVLSEAILLAVIDKLDSHSIELLALAAVFHDTGYIEQSTQNEPIGVRYAKYYMEKSGYSPMDIEVVAAAIMDTTMHFIPALSTIIQVPTTHLGRYLADADLGNFGRDDFLEKSKSVFAELKGKIWDDASEDEQSEFLKGSAQLLRAHSWHTTAARSTREVTKKQNIRRVERLIND